MSTQPGTSKNNKWEPIDTINLLLWILMCLTIGHVGSFFWSWLIVLNGYFVCVSSICSFIGMITGMITGATAIGISLLINAKVREKETQRWIRSLLITSNEFLGYMDSLNLDTMERAFYSFRNIHSTDQQLIRFCSCEFAKRLSDIDAAMIDSVCLFHKGKSSGYFKPVVLSDPTSPSLFDLFRSDGELIEGIRYFVHEIKERKKLNEQELYDQDDPSDIFKYKNVRITVRKAILIMKQLESGLRRWYINPPLDESDCERIKDFCNRYDESWRQLRKLRWPRNPPEQLKPFLTRLFIL